MSKKCSNSNQLQCWLCYRNFTRKYSRDTHLWKIHNYSIGGRFRWWVCPECSRQFRLKKELNLHLRKTHPDPVASQVLIPNSSPPVVTNSNPSPELLISDPSEPNPSRDEKPKNKSSGYPCDQYECSAVLSSSSSRNDHLWNVHKIDLTGNHDTHPCDDCEREFNNIYSLERHLWRVHHHNPQGKFQTHDCDQPMCSRSFKFYPELSKHLWFKHKIDLGGKYQIHPCDYCSEEFPSDPKLKEHLWKSHHLDPDRKYQYPCSECTQVFRTQHQLNKHLSTRHDIGKYSCETCEQNVAKVISYQSSQTRNKKIKVCRRCYRRYTGYAGRIEEQMAHFLQRDPQIGPYFVLRDKIIRGESCQTLRRPDLYLSSSSRLHIIVECDEKQHRDRSEKCERGRIDEILDEIPLKGRVVIIRWNPHGYQRYRSNTCRPPLIKSDIPKKKRLEYLRDFILSLTQRSEKEWPSEQFILIYYMYYSQDRNDLVTYYYHRHIYLPQDFPEPSLITHHQFDPRK